MFYKYGLPLNKYKYKEIMLVIAAFCIGTFSVFLGTIDISKLMKFLLVFIITLTLFVLGIKNTIIFKKGFLFIFTITMALPLTYAFNIYPESDIARPLPIDLYISMIHVIILAYLLIFFRNSINRFNFYWPSIANPLVGFMILGFLSTFYPHNANPAASFFGSFLIMSMIIFIFLVTNICNFEEVFTSVWWAFAGAVCLQTCFVVAYSIFHIETAITIFSKTAILWASRGEILRAVGTTDHPGMLALYLSSILPFFISSYILGYRKKISMVIIGLLIMDIFLTQARTAMAASFITSLLLIFLLRFKGKPSYYIKGIVFILLIIVAFIFLVCYSEWGQRLFFSQNFQDMWLARYFHWQLGLEIFRENPILGVGFNSHVDYISKYLYLGNIPIVGEDFFYTNPIHNSHIVILTELGLVGYLFWISVYYGLIRGSYKLFRSETDKKNQVVFIFIIGSAVTILIYSFFGWAAIRPIMYYQTTVMIILFDRAKMHVPNYNKNGT